MNKFPVVSMVVAILAFLGAVYISKKMSTDRAALYHDPARAELKYFPILGMEKFLADVRWIKLIQDMGEPGVVVDNSVAGKKYARQLYKRANWITNFNPDADKIYETMALKIASGDPDLAIKLLEKGNQLSRNKQWKRSNYASQFAMNVSKNTKDKVEKKKRLEQAAKYLKEAIDMGTGSQDLEPRWLRWKAQIAGYESNALQNIIEKKRYYEEKAADLMSHDASPTPEGVSEGFSEPTLDADIKAKLFKDCQKLAMVYYHKLYLTKIQGAERTEVEKNYAHLKKVFADIGPTSPYSEYSLLFYAPGDFYDVATGRKVRPYGISWGAWEKNKQIVILKGAYCQVTGMSRKESDKKWEEYWQKNKD